MSVTTAPAAQAPTKKMDTHTDMGIPKKRLMVIFVGLILGILMAALDQTIVSTALPYIGSDLNGFQQITWIITTYLLAQTIVMPIYGKLGDFIGRKLAFQIAIVIFLAGSVLAGLSTSMDMLIAMRAVQGIGAGGLMIGAQTLIAEIVSARERGKYMSVMGPMIGVATVLGPLLGGWLTETVSWNWIFYINVPLGIASLIIVGLVLKVPQQRHKPHVDYWGTLFLGGAAAALVLLLTWGGRTYDWTSWTIIGLMAGAVALAAAFIWAERRAVEPIMPLRLFKDNVFRTNSILSFLIGLALFGAVSYLPTYLQISLGASATMSGILMLPLMGGLMAAAVVTGQLISRTGRYKVFPVLGTAIGAVGMFLLSLMDAGTPQSISSIYMVVLGIGIGLIMPTLVLVVQNSVPKEDVGSATAGVNFFRQIGGSFGTAIIGSLFVGRLATNLSQNLPASFMAKLGGHAQGVTSDMLDKFPQEIANDYVASYADALTPLYMYLAPVILIGFVVAWFLKEKPLATGSASRGGTEPAVRDEPVEAPASEQRHAPSLPDPVIKAFNTLHARDAGRNGFHGSDGTEQSVSGNVYHAAGTAAAARLSLLDLGGKHLQHVDTGSDGSYRLRLPGPGTYLLAVLPQHGTQHRPAAELVTAGEGGVVRDFQLAID